MSDNFAVCDDLTFPQLRLVNEKLIHFDLPEKSLATFGYRSLFISSSWMWSEQNVMSGPLNIQVSIMFARKLLSKCANKCRVLFEWSQRFLERYFWKWHKVVRFPCDPFEKGFILKFRKACSGDSVNEKKVVCLLWRNLSPLHKVSLSMLLLYDEKVILFFSFLDTFTSTKNASKATTIRLKSRSIQNQCRVTSLWTGPETRLRLKPSETL